MTRRLLEIAALVSRSLASGLVHVLILAIVFSALEHARARRMSYSRRL